MAEIVLTKGFVAIVDDADFDWLNQWKWNAHNNKPNLPNYYAQRMTYGDPDGRRRHLTMHRVIMGAPAKTIVDHRNGDTLDNRRENLRLCSAQQSCCNRGLYASKQIPYKGVFESKGRFGARISLDGRTYYIGGYATPIEAAAAYDARARELHGEFARLNFPDEAA